MSFRSLAQNYQASPGRIYENVSTYLSNLPHCADVTRRYARRYGGILLVDGKYLLVKGYERKIPVLYGIDYLTHDIPTYLLSVSEGYQTCLSFFKSLRLLNYPLQALVCDENINITEACRAVYPKVAIQLCQNHYKENIRRSLDLRLNPQYQGFMLEIEALFKCKRSAEDFNLRAGNVLSRYGSDPLCSKILYDLARSLPLLLGYLKVKKVPTTTNLIECFNSHLQGRLKTIKGFESFSHADTWLNGYFLRRRLRRFTGCTGKFKELNGLTSLEKAGDEEMDLPELF